MFSVQRSQASALSAIDHVRRIVAQADWDARPTFCYRLRAALREAVADIPRSEDMDQRLRAVMRAAEYFSNALRPNFTPATIDLLARLDELEKAGVRALQAQATQPARAA